VEIPRQLTPEEYENLEELPTDDKCSSIDTVAEGYRIWAINQQADRFVRLDLIAEMKSTIHLLDSIDLVELEDVVEEEAARFENAFIQLFSDNPENESEAPKVPVFAFYE